MSKESKLLEGIPLRVAKYLAHRDKQEKWINCDYDELPQVEKEIYNKEALDLIDIISTK